MKTFWTKYKTPILLIIGVIVIALLLSGGRYSYKYHISELQRLTDSIQVYQDSITSLKISFRESEKEISEKKSNLKNYYNDYIREKQKREKLQDQVSNIQSLIFDRRYLDSLKSAVEYR